VCLRRSWRVIPGSGKSRPKGKSVSGHGGHGTVRLACHYVFRGIMLALASEIMEVDGYAVLEHRHLV
jgi:hypothetical protein